MGLIMFAMIDYEAISLSHIQEFRRTGNKEELLKLYNLHKKLFYKLAAKYSFLMDQEDILQECYIALEKAVNDYQEEKGSFTAYLPVTINNILYRTIQQTNNNIPEYMTSLIKRYFSLLASLEENIKPSDTWIAGQLNISLETLNTVYIAITAQNITSLNISLDNEEEGETLEDITPSNYNLEEACINDLFAEEVKERVNECISLLSASDQELITKHYIQEQTYKEIDPTKSITRTKQKVDKAFRRLQRVGKVKLEPLHREYIYTKTVKSGGLQSFRRTWTSPTERIILRMEEKGTGL